MNEKYVHWKPAVLCAVFAVICTVSGLAVDFMNSGSSLGRQIDFPFALFSISLPMCFYHVAMITTRLQFENRVLRQLVVELQRRDASQPNDVA